jgi:hypothetical protein
VKALFSPSESLQGETEQISNKRSYGIVWGLAIAGAILGVISGYGLITGLLVGGIVGLVIFFIGHARS